MEIMKLEERKSQEYDLGCGVTVLVMYPPAAKPPMLLDDDVVLIAIDRGKFDLFKRGGQDAIANDGLGPAIGRPAYAGATARSLEFVPGRSRDLTPEQRAEALARLGESPSPKPITKPRPLNSADLFAAAGAPMEMLAAIERAAQEG